MLRQKTSPIISLLISLPCSALLSLTSVAHAAEPEPEPYPTCETETADTTAAKGAFQAGTAAFNEADYERAITYWEDAYRRDCRAHALLKNLARAYELNGMYKHAIVALNTYMERNPNPGEKESLERRIANLQAKLDERGPETEPEPQPEPQQVPEPEPDPLPVEDAPVGGSRPIWPLIIAGAGGVVGAIGLVQFLGAKSDEEQAAADCETWRQTNMSLNENSRQCAPEIAARGNEAIDDVNLWGAVSIAGAGVAVTGLVIYFALPEQESVAVTPQLAPGYAGLNYATTF